ncbi:MAG: hypothetical protein M3R27_14770 [Bacteroidota bacterium]|nr:hypothetical protein [Bacteroidota bacterium]
MRLVTLLLFLNCINTLSAQSKLYMEEIGFLYKSSALTYKDLDQIRKIWEILPTETSVQLILVSDKEIKKLKPQQLVTLSKERATAISRFLTTQKIVSPYDIELNLHNFTEKEKVHGSKSSIKQIVRDPYKVYSLILSKEVPLCFNYTDAERIALSSKSPSTFSVNANESAVIKGPEGVIISISPNSFVLPEENKAAEINIQLWEFLSTEDIIRAGLSTMSSGRLLETGGMIYITAKHNGSCLKLLRSAKITVQFPTYSRVDSMRLFKGVPLPLVIDWKKTDNVNQSESPTTTESIPDMEGGERARLSYYVLSASGLGWINCDRFYDVKEKTDLAFTLKGNFKGYVGLVFTELNSVLPGDIVRQTENNVIFKNVPKGMEVVALVYAFSTDIKKVFYAKQKIFAGDLPKEELKLQEGTVAEFKQFLKEIKD